MSYHTMTVHVDAATAAEQTAHHCDHPGSRASWRLSGNTGPITVYVSGTVEELLALARRLEDAAWEWRRLRDDACMDPLFDAAGLPS